MATKTLSSIRSSFLDYFKSKGHLVLPSSPLIPHNDPSLMFTNAGMVQFKNVFAGREEIKDKQGKAHLRATTSQKCVRAGGKHNDLENVGYTARHHTFFEMLGNFSFGDYFKDDAISFAWEFLTKTISLPKEKLCVTIYHNDDEAFNIWKKIGVAEDKIIRISSDDNFWAMGDTGPCGPCSEIFFDHGDKVAGDPPGSANADGDRFVEIWNLVFMQYEKLENGDMINLPKPCIDTGMGLERLTTVLQNVHDNYETDIFIRLIEASKNLSGQASKEFQNSHRVIADHLRSTCFLIADGVLPSNEGRGYVLRRIMRRAMRHCHRLNPSKPLFYRLVPALLAEMSEAYPELERARSVITQTIENEEERFRETLATGLKILEGESKHIKNKTLSGEIAFKLYDTYGFPLDLTQDILREKGAKVDEVGFNQALEKQKEKARASWAGSGEASTENLWLELSKKLGATEFLGYSATKSSGDVIAIICNGEERKTISQSEGAIITNQTPFYAESGGQAGDKGIIKTDKGVFEVSDTKKLAGSLFVHFGKMISGEIKLHDIAKLEIDENRRSKIRKNHSATHILHAVLRNILGDFVTQKGSLVEADYLRFDFSYNKPLSDEEIKKIELEVNRIIAENSSVSTKIMKLEQAIDSGAMALFGEKYSDDVRVLSMGSGYSVELCGGTHIERTGDIGLFRITRESGVASGVRRIEAVTEVKALEFVYKKEEILNQISEKLKTSEAEISDKIEKLISERKEFEKQVSDLKKKIALGNSRENQSSQNEVEIINGVNFIAKKLEGIDAKDLRGIVDEIKTKHTSCVVFLVSENEGKVSVLAGVTNDLVSKISAVDIVKKSVEIMGGKGGGGRPDFAQGGTPNLDNYLEALGAVKGLIA
ncbi:MAG: alanine--tRNA ligase [Rickettsiales bacterium]|nr:alanine--tRNA ligase [Rickettsiales bacterium]